MGEDAPDNYARYYESAKVALLNDALMSPAASVIDRVGGLSDETLQVIEPLMLAREAERRYGEGVFGLYVISMTRELSDLLEPLLLMRWARTSLPITPLFETLDDLRRAPDVLRALEAEARAVEQPLPGAAVRQRARFSPSRPECNLGGSA